MARALSPARVDKRGWYLHSEEIDLCRRLNRRYDNCAGREELIHRINERHPGSNAGPQQQLAAPPPPPISIPMDLDVLDTGGEVDSPVDAYHVFDAEGTLISLAELQLEGDTDKTEHQTLVLRGKRNSTTFEREIVSWRVEFDQKPLLFVKDVQDTWIKLNDPIPLYANEEGKSLLTLLEFLNAIKNKVSPSPIPPQEALRTHSELLKKLVARDPDLKDANAQSLPKKRKLNPDEPGPSSKRLKEKEPEDDELPEDGPGDGTGEEEDENGESICAICDDGGDLICCDGPCLRSFHTACFDDLKVAPLKASSSFCSNCSQHQHQCFGCGRLGSSQGSTAEVFLCDVAYCGRFYHRACVKNGGGKNGGGKNGDAELICPLHSCARCGKGNEESELYECRRCPKAWHQNCADERIVFGDGAPGQRAWVLGKARFLYCMQHSIDINLKTPKRNHLAFPEVRAPKPPRVSTTSQRHLQDVEASVQAVIDESKRVITVESVEKKLFRPNTTGAAPAGLCHKNMMKSQVDAFNKARKCIERGGDWEEARRLCPPARFRKFYETLKVYLSPLLYGMRYSTYGRHFTVTEKLQAVVDRLCWYISPGDTIADLCCGANEFSRLLSKKLASMKINSNFKNFDLFQPIDTFCFERRDYTTIEPAELGDPGKLIIGLNPPFGVNAHLASKYAKFAASFKPKIIILIAPKETLGLESQGYQLLWEDRRLFEGNAFYFPGSTDSTGHIISHENHDAPYLFFWSRREWNMAHEAIAISKGHSPRVGVVESPLPSDAPQTRISVVAEAAPSSQSRALVKAPVPGRLGWFDHYIEPRPPSNFVLHQQELAPSAQGPPWQPGFHPGFHFGFPPPPAFHQPPPAFHQPVVFSHPPHFPPPGICQFPVPRWDFESPR